MRPDHNPVAGEPIVFDTPATNSSWPKVLGIIAIVLGALAAVGSCIGAGASFFAGAMVDLVPEGEASGLEGMMAWQSWLVGLSVLATGLGIGLLVGGVGLVRRRPFAATACLGWAILKMVYVLASAFVGYQVNVAQFEVMQNDPNMAGMPAGFMGAVSLFGATLGVLWGWALPIFMLIWFSRRRIHEEVESWGLSAHQMPVPAPAAARFQPSPDPFLRPDDSAHHGPAAPGSADPGRPAADSTETAA